MLGVLEKSGWRIEFFRASDRVGHRVWRLTEAGPLAIAESVEGRPDQHWPGSPPFQQVHFEERAGGKIALLVGMAGRSHWSGSVEIRPEFGGPLWDVACRTSDAPQWLGMSYRPAVPVQIQGDQVVLRADADLIGVASSFEVDSRIQIDFDGIALRWCVATSQLAQARTYRWRYWLVGPADETGAAAEEAAPDDVQDPAE